MKSERTSKPTSKRTVLTAIIGGSVLLLSGATVHAADERTQTAQRYHSEFWNDDREEPSRPYAYEIDDRRYAPSGPACRYDRNGRYTGDGYRSPRYESGRYDQGERHEYRRRIANIRNEYEKAMQRLDRQERESRDWVYRHYDSSHPHFHARMAKIDRKFAHKRDRVERRAERKYRELGQRYGYDYTNVGYGRRGNALTRR